MSEALEYKLFWSQTKRGLLLDPFHFKAFLESRGIFKYYPSENEAFIFIIKNGHFIDTITLERIKDIVLNQLQKDSHFGAWSLMASHVNYFTKDFLGMLDVAKINIISDTKDTAFIYYKNKAVKVTPDKFELINYSKIGGFVWKKQVVKRNITLLNESNGVFKSFIWKISGENIEKYFTLKSVIGFLLHSYKDSSKNRAIIFNDEMISDEPNGGSGKGLFHKAVGHVKKVSTIDGKFYNPDKSFVFQTVSPDSQILLFDDVKRAFNFEALFSVITEELQIEKKRKDPVVLPFDRSPKVSITTNYTIKGEGGSFHRRVFEVEISSYFNESYTPEMEYKHLFFDEWKVGEWSKFDNYMLRSVQYFLKEGLKQSENKNLKYKKIINATTRQFVDFMDDTDFNGERYTGSDFRVIFENAYPDFLKHKWFNGQLFNIWIEKYCRYKGLELVKGKSNGLRWFSIMQKDGQLTLQVPESVPEGGDDLPF